MKLKIQNSVLYLKNLILLILLLSMAFVSDAQTIVCAGSVNGSFDPLISRKKESCPGLLDGRLRLVEINDPSPGTLTYPITFEWWDDTDGISVGTGTVACDGCSPVTSSGTGGNTGFTLDGSHNYILYM